MIVYTIDPSMSEEDNELLADFLDTLNENIEKGNLLMEVDDDGEARLYPSE